MNSTSLYLHFPICKHVCSYCDFNVRSLATHPEFENLWIDAILRHFEGRASEIPASRELKTLYLGGGTPSLLSPQGFEKLISGLQKTVSWGEKLEFTLEANPETIDEKSLKVWKNVGINRLSIGVQSFQPQVLHRLERLATSDHLDRVVKLVPEFFENYSLDLMIGVPDQTREFLERDLARITEVRPPHLSIYMLTIAPDHKWLLSSAMKPRMVSEEKMEEFYSRVFEVMSGLQYRHYEISNFAREGWESRHNSNYWNVESPYIGLGPGAHGYRIEGTRKIRYEMIRDLKTWAAHPSGLLSEEDLSAEQQRLERLYLSLRTRKPVPTNELDEQGIVAARDAGAAELHQDRLVLTEQGWLFMETWASKLIP